MAIDRIVVICIVIAYSISYVKTQEQCNPPKPTPPSFWRNDTSCKNGPTHETQRGQQTFQCHCWRNCGYLCDLSNEGSPRSTTIETGSSAIANRAQSGTTRRVTTRSPSTTRSSRTTTGRPGSTTRSSRTTTGRPGSTTRSVSTTRNPQSGCFPPPPIPPSFWRNDTNCENGGSYKAQHGDQIFNCHCWGNCGYFCDLWSSGGTTRITTRRPGSTTRRPGSTTRNPGSTTRRPGSTTRRPGSTTRRPGSTTRRPGSTTRNPLRCNPPPPIPPQFWRNDTNCVDGTTYKAQHGSITFHCRCWGHCGYFCDPWNGGRSTTRRPGSTTRRPGSTTRRPGSTTRRPGSTTRRPGVCNPPPPIPPSFWRNDTDCPNGDTYKSQHLSLTFHCHCWGKCGYFCDPWNGGRSTTRRPGSTSRRPGSTTRRPGSTTRRPGGSCNPPPPIPPSFWRNDTGCDLGPTYKAQHGQQIFHCHCWGHCGYFCDLQGVAETTRRPGSTTRRPGSTTRRPGSTTRRPGTTTEPTTIVPTTPVVFTPCPECPTCPTCATPEATTAAITQTTSQSQATSQTAPETTTQAATQTTSQSQATSETAAETTTQAPTQTTSQSQATSETAAETTTQAPTQTTSQSQGTSETQAETTTQAETSASATETTTESTTEGPTAGPSETTTEATTEATTEGTTETTTEGPTTEGPTDGPTTEGPTEGPTTEGPTDGPTSEGPTDGPTNGPTDGGPSESTITEDTQATDETDTPSSVIILSSTSSTT